MGRSKSEFDLLGASDEQRALVAEAFAGDNVIEEEFIQEKKTLEEGGKVADKDVTLPGWGVWGGAGIKNPFPSQ